TSATRASIQTKKRLSTIAKTTSVCPLEFARLRTARSRAGDGLHLPHRDFGGGEDLEGVLQVGHLGVSPDPVLVDPDAPVLRGRDVVGAGLADPGVGMVDGGAAERWVDVLPKATGVREVGGLLVAEVPVDAHEARRHQVGEDPRAAA